MGSRTKFDWTAGISEFYNAQGKFSNWLQSSDWSSPDGTDQQFENLAKIGSSDEIIKNILLNCSTMTKSMISGLIGELIYSMWPTVFEIQSHYLHGTLFLRGLHWVPGG